MDTDTTATTVATEQHLPGPDVSAPEPGGNDRVLPGRKPLRWLLEGTFIVVSVLLGFSLTEYGEYRRERALAARVIASIQAEMEHNHATLELFVPIHRTWQEALAQQDPAQGTGSAIDVLFATRPPLPSGMQSNVPLPRHAAWDTALSTGALRLIDYDLAAGLSEIYAMQEYATGTFTKPFAEPAFFDAASRSATIRLTQTMMRELLVSEERLLELYDNYLPVIRASSATQ